MLAVQKEFETRTSEVKRYFQFLRDFDDNLLNFSPGAKLSSASEKMELYKTLKANGFLLLYNLVESTLKNAIEAVFDEFKLKKVTFDDCRLEVRKLVLQNLKNQKIDRLIPDLVAISTDVLTATFRKEELVSGNVDAKHVRDLAKRYGFDSPKVKSDELLTVKTNRNDLAHGMKSFAEVGRDFDINRLEVIHAEVIGFLKALLKSIASYISRRGYLAATAAK